MFCCSAVLPAFSAGATAAILNLRSVIHTDKDYFMDAAFLKGVLEVLAGFDSPCDRGAIDGMFDDWCEKHCGEAPKTECWKKFFELKIAEIAMIEANANNESEEL